MKTATGNQAVSPDSPPTAARSRCRAQRAALTSFFCALTAVCGNKLSATPSFPPEIQKNSQVRHGQKQLSCPSPIAGDNERQWPCFSRAFVQKTRIWPRTRSRGIEQACRLLRQTCPKLAISLVDIRHTHNRQTGGRLQDTRFNRQLRECHKPRPPKSLRIALSGTPIAGHFGDGPKAVAALRHGLSALGHRKDVSGRLVFCDSHVPAA